MSDLRTAIARALVAKAKPILTARWEEHCARLQEDPSLVMGRSSVQMPESKQRVVMGREEYNRILEGLYFDAFQKGFWAGVVDSIDVGFDMGQSADDPTDKLK